jgi:membrane protease YdiL (CAAX protease family)
VRDYLGWIRPRGRDVAIGIPAILALPVGFMLADLLSGMLTSADPAVQAYRAGIAAGMSPWWFVLGYWPAETLAPLVEESFFRGFLWRGLQLRLGNVGTLLLTSIVFAAMHYNYYIQDGVADPVSIVQYLVAGLVLGGLRWHSGGSTVPMIVHAVSNVWVSAQVVLLAALVP